MNSKLEFAEKGQSLLEVIVGVGIVTIVLVGLISVITVSLANAQFSRSRTQANKYAQEASEWLRGQRDEMSWADFYTKATSGGRYCLASLDWFVDNNNCPVINDDVDMYTRRVVLTPVCPIDPCNDDKVAIHITVSWVQGQRTPSVELDTYLTKWK